MKPQFCFKPFRFTLIAAILAMSFMLAYDAAASHNFLTNPGAENGLTGWTSSYTGSGAVSGIVDNSVTVVSPHTGGAFFSVRGPGGTPCVTLSQTVNVSNYASLIDAGQVKLNLSGWAFWLDGRDAMALDFFFFHQSGAPIGGRNWMDVFPTGVWTLVETNNFAVPANTRSIRVDLAGAISGTLSVLDAYFDDISLTLTVPELSVNKTSLAFGNLYVYDGANASAKTFNDNKSQTFTISNPGSTTLTWSAATNQPGMSLSETSGSIFAGGNKTVTVKFNPQAVGNYPAVPITISSDAGNASISTSATAYYGSPEAVKRTAPAFGSNSKVNMAINDSVKFVVASANPLYPGATIRGYQWQVVSGTPTGPGTNWTEVNITEYTNPANAFSTASDYTVYVRMVDSNGVGAAHLAIPVHAWNRPTVADTPPTAAIPAHAGELSQPTKVSWLQSKYVGVKGSAVKLQATATTNTGSSISEYRWDFDNNFGTVELTQTATALASYTPTTSNLNGQIKVKAVTNFGIESAEKLFNLKSYDTVTANPGGPYNGRPTKPVALTGSINTTAGPSAAFAYQWQVQGGRGVYHDGGITRHGSHGDAAPCGPQDHHLPGNEG